MKFLAWVATLTSLTATLFHNTTTASAADFVLVDENTPPAPIVLFADAPPLTREAAVTLADSIEKMCGKRPEIIDGEPKPIPERAIWVGMQPAVKTRLPQVDVEFKHAEEILLATDGKHLLVAGRDSWDPNHMNVTVKKGVVKGEQHEYGTANAVFTLLQDKLGARWFWPGPLGEDLPKQTAIRLAPFEFRYHPQIRSRSGVLHYSGLGVTGYGISHDWTRLQRLSLQSLGMEGGHGFGDWWDRFHTDHPDWFALQPNGERNGFPSPHNAKLCESNEEVARQWLADVEAKLAADPTQTVFNASANDGWASGHCTCEKCRAWDSPDGESRRFNWLKQNELHPALTDRAVTFANRLAAMLKERYPDKDYKVMLMAYGHTRPAPVKAKPADNVIISSVANFLGRKNLVDDGSTRGTTHREQYEAWTKHAKHLMWRPNTGSPAGWQQGLPDVSLEQTIEDFKLVGRSGCLGIYVDGVWEHWATMGPMYYLMGQLTWNPEADGHAILDDYFARAFGPAAEPVRAYYTMFEKARMDYTDQHGYEGGLENLAALYTPDLLATARGHLKRAAEAAASGPEIYRKRVEFVGVGLQWTELVVANARLMKDYWKKPTSEVAEQVRANWKVMEALATANRPAINWGPSRPMTPRMAGLHPDYPPKKGKKKPAKDLDLN
jgi:hypothetical protein